MVSRGLHTLVKFLLRPAVLVTLFATLLLIFIFRKKVILSKAIEIFNAVKFWGINENLARIIVAQSAHETAGFTSLIFRQNNNAFGMKYVGQSQALGEKNGYANYSSLANSVADLVRWIQAKRSPLINLLAPIKTTSEYVSFLKAYNYFEDDINNYLNGVNHWFKQLYS